MKTNQQSVQVHPETVYKYYSAVKSITPQSTQQYRWAQSETLSRMYLGVSYLIVLPTGEGKTLIADFLTAMYLETGKKVLFCVPFLALMNEQYNEAKKKWPAEESGIRIKRFIKGAFGCSINKSHLIFSTYERAQGILQKLLSQNIVSPNNNPFKEIGLIVMDEIHTLGDPQRGKVVEWLIMMARVNKIPILGLTGTMELPDAIKLGNYMDSCVAFSDIRSVPLPIHFYFSSISPLKMSFIDNPSYSYKKLTIVKDGDRFYDESTLETVDINSIEGDFKALNQVFRIVPSPSVFHSLSATSFRKEGQKTLLMAMIVDYLNRSDTNNNLMNGVLIYIPTKVQINQLLNIDQLENTRESYKCLNLPIIPISPKAKVHSQKKLASLKAKHITISRLNTYLIPLGYAVHTGDIATNEERDLVTDLYEHHSVRIIFATSTLSAGVNLRNLSLVVIIGTWRFEHKIPMNEIIQTAGRAGRSRGFPGEAWIFYTLEDDIKTYDPNVTLKTIKGLNNLKFEDLPPSKRGPYRGIDPDKLVPAPQDFRLTPEIPSTLYEQQFNLTDWRKLILTTQSIIKQIWINNWEIQGKGYKRKWPYYESVLFDVYDEYTSFMVLKKAIPFIKSIICDKCQFPITSNIDNCLRVMCQLMGIYKETAKEAYDSFLKWDETFEEVCRTMQTQGLIDRDLNITFLGEDLGILNMDIDSVREIQKIFLAILDQRIKIGAQEEGTRNLFNEVSIIWMIILCSDISVLIGPVKSIASKIKNKADDVVPLVQKTIDDFFKSNALYEQYKMIFELDKLKEIGHLEHPLMIRSFAFIVVWNKLQNPGDWKMFNVDMQSLNCYSGDITACFVDGLRVLIDYLTYSHTFSQNNLLPQEDQRISIHGSSFSNAFAKMSPIENILLLINSMSNKFKLFLDPYNVIIFKYLSLSESSKFPDEKLFVIVSEMRRQWKASFKGYYDKESDIRYFAQTTWRILNDQIKISRYFHKIKLLPGEEAMLRKAFQDVLSQSQQDPEDPFYVEYKEYESKMNN